MSDKVADPDREIKMGSEVRDRVSGLEGVITASQLTLNGMFQWAVCPRGDGKDLPEGWNIDPAQLEWIGEGLEGVALPPAEYDIALGDEVEDIVSGFRGVVTQWCDQLNGCVLLRVEAPLSTEEGDKVSARVQAPYMAHLIGRWKKVEAAKAPVTPRTRSGGPASRMERM